MSTLDQRNVSNAKLT